MDDDAIRALVTRLARPCGDGGHVVERAAIRAAGPESAAVETWIIAHAGRPEQTDAASARGRGLHGHRVTSPADRTRPARRFLLPAAALEHLPPTSADMEPTHALEDPHDHVVATGQAPSERG